MNAPAGLIGAAWAVQEQLSRAGFSFCIIGGLALARWGEPRYTQDIDLSVLCPYGEELGTARRLAQLFEPRFAGAIEFAVESRVFLARTADGIPVDIAFGAIDFEFRDDLTFHSGNKFSADDVKYTLDYAIDPKIKLRNKERYTWVRAVEKLGPNKLRFLIKEPFAADLHTISYRFYIYDQEVHKGLANKADYGRANPSTTGLYRIVSVDENQGVKLERFEPAVGKFTHRRAPIKYIETKPISDRQTQIAQLLTGGVEMVREISAEMTEQFQGSANVAITPMQSKLLAYINFDALGRSGNPVFKDIRVRQAFIKAIPREQIVKTYIAGAEVAEIPKAICFAKNDACSPTTQPLSYDPYRAAAEAMAGELRKVGIRAAVQPMTLSVITKKRQAGELTAQLQVYPTFAQPTMDNILNHFFEGGRDYADDPVIHEAAKLGYGEIDVAKRTAIYRKAIDRVNEMAYVFPFSEQPTVFAHSKDVKIEPNLFSLSEVRLGDFFWR